MPPFVGIEVKVTEVAEHMVEDGSAEMLTKGVEGIKVVVPFTTKLREPKVLAVDPAPYSLNLIVEPCGTLKDKVPLL